MDAGAAILSLLLHIKLPSLLLTACATVVAHPMRSKVMVFAVTIAVSNSVVIILKLKLPMAATSFPDSSKPEA